MKSILVFGATGNIGIELIHFLFEQNSKNKIYAAVRNSDRAKKSFNAYPNLHYRIFDFDDQKTYPKAFENIDTLFLLRPPHISDVKKYFPPLLSAAQNAGIKEILFLSVQGVEKSKIIPHHKIEALIKSYSFDYIFIRPSYFMQNLTTSLRSDIITLNKIILPAGNAKFNWVDVKNIAEATAVLIDQFQDLKNQAIEISGSELENFQTVANKLTSILGRKISYENRNPVSFYFLKRKAGIASGYIMVMIMLHFIARFQKTPSLSSWYEKLCAKKPTLLNEFIEREKSLLINPEDNQ